MMSLFSSFDFFFFKFTWISFVLICLNIGKHFYSYSSTIQIFTLLNLNMLNFFYSLKPKSFNKFSHMIFITIFLIMIIINSSSVFSYNFALSSQISMMFFTALSFWLSFLIFNLFKALENFLSHLIPEGTPMILVIFLFLIELISNIIRPLTLTVRLVANILAGHLLMILLSMLVLKTLLIFPFYVMLNLIEIMVALIQSYIFSTMLVLYFSEV